MGTVLRSERGGGAGFVPRGCCCCRSGGRVDEPLGLEELDQREQTVYALDATTIDLCLSVFPWARFRSTKAGVKMHTLLDLRGNIPAFTWLTEARFADVRILDALIPEPGSIYLFDRGFVSTSCGWTASTQPTRSS
ncbi:hypothetical protein BH23GEM4_BH23GEM4_09290 [soil metagenome]